jgi:methionyl aminopeptidase
VNEVICHGIPDSRELEEGDIVNVDISVYKWGFHSDLNETFFVGKVDDAGRKLVRTAYECLMKSIALGSHLVVHSLVRWPDLCCVCAQ